MIMLCSSERTSRKEENMGIFQKIEQWLQGKKAYIVMLSGIIAALLGYLDGQLTIMQALTALWAALGLGAIRSGIGKVTK